MREEFWKQPNGLYFVTVDNEQKRATVIVPSEWKIELIPSNSGARLIERGSREGGVHFPGLPNGVLGRVSNAKLFVCVQREPAPTISRSEKG